MTDITGIIVGVILVIIGLIAWKAWPFIKARVSSEQLTMLAGIARTAVFAAEQIFGAKMGKDKLAYAIKVVQEFLQKKGLTFDVEVIRAAIEAQVKLHFGKGTVEE